MKSFTGASLSATYAYNGLGDRIQQTENGVPQPYLLDTAAGLTQVLADGAHTYLYGVDRISSRALPVWSYIMNNPINLSDLPGYLSQNERIDADNILSELNQRLSISIIIDWGDSSQLKWNGGNWSIRELEIIQRASHDLSVKLGGEPSFVQKLGGIEVEKRNISTPGQAVGQQVTFWDSIRSFSKWTVVHEFAHVWDMRNNWLLSDGLEIFTGGYTNPEDRPHNCDPESRLPGCNNANYYYGGIPSHGSDIKFNRREDFAESVTAYVYPSIARKDVEKYSKSIELRDFLYYANYKKTRRWIYVNGLIKGTILPDQLYSPKKG